MTADGGLPARLRCDEKASGGLVFVQGSGPGDRDWWDWPERFAAVGVATLAYDKPGVGESEGDWMLQTLEDRAIEAIAAADALAEGAGIGTDRGGLLEIGRASCR